MKLLNSILIKLDEKKRMLCTKSKQMKIEETVSAWHEILSFEMDFGCLEQLRNNNQCGEQKVFRLNASPGIF